MQRSAKTFRRGLRIQEFLLLVLLILFAEHQALAQVSVGGGAYATRGFRGRAPLKVVYSMELAPSMTIGFVKVSITDPTGPSKVDRRLRVVLYTHNYGQNLDNLAYHYDIVLAEGMTSTSFEIPFISAESQFAWDVGVFEEGRDIEDTRKSKKSNQPEYHWAYNFNQTGNLMWVAGLMATNADPKSEARNLNAVTTYLNAQTPVQNSGFAGTTAVATSPLNLTLDQASSDWRKYFPYPMWIASVEAVAEINEKYPKVADALRTYVSAGGILLVYEVKSSGDMASLNRLLSNTGGNAELASWKSIGSPTPPWWILPPREQTQPSPSKSSTTATAPTPDLPATPATQANPATPATPSTNAASSTKTPEPESPKAQPAIEGAGAMFDAALLTDTLLETGLGSHRDNLNGLMAVLGFEDMTLEQLEEGRARLLTALTTDKLLQREYGRGKIIICNRSLHELQDNQIAMFTNAKDDKSIGALTARSHDGSWFWQNLILEVGKPPVWAFGAMVALFGLLLGPGLLAFTGRMQRRSLMIFLVPSVSLVATLAIILYGVLHEGFDTHVRIHSVTVYDTPAQVAFGWSRQNYFSGMPPREGLQFSEQAYVRCVGPEDASNYSGMPDPRYNIEGTVAIGEKQIWNEWLKPRQHQQLLVGHKVDPKTIPIATERAESGQLVLTNRTAMTLPLVVLRGDKDDYYLETDLAPNESRELEVKDIDTVTASVSRIGVDYKPTIPPELDGGSDSLLNFGNPRRYSRTYMVQASEIINDAFKRYLSDDLDLEPHGFAALVPEFEPIEIPLKGIQSDCVNLVIGVDPW